MIAPHTPAASSGSEGSPARPSDPRIRNRLLLTEWEQDNTMTICAPHGHVLVSDKLLAQGFEEGRSFVKALCAAAHKEWMQELRPASD